MPGGVFDLEEVENQPGMTILIVSGRGADVAFKNEAGGHRFQRVPPTEKRGRVQTSTITVAVLSVPEESQIHICEEDLDWKTCRGSGAGGQHRNKTDSAVMLTHLPTKTVVRCESERSQYQNKASALAVLRARLLQREVDEKQNTRNQERRGQVGTGMRGDKRRTIAMQRDQVHDHLTDKKMSVKQYLRGAVDELW